LKKMDIDPTLRHSLVGLALLVKRARCEGSSRWRFTKQASSKMCKTQPDRHFWALILATLTKRLTTTRRRCALQWIAHRSCDSEPSQAGHAVCEVLAARIKAIQDPENIFNQDLNSRPAM
jgi:hypothetical protein